MGSLLSIARPRLRSLFNRAFVRALRFISPSLDALIKRLSQSPGIPVPHPTLPYWTVPPSPISKHGSGPEAQLPGYADIVIIGSGITGTSFARTILDADRNRDVSGEPLQVVMLEARDTCSGATGRNGGHITPILYADYIDLKEEHGVEIAKKIIRFRLSHLPELLAVAEEEGLLEDSQCREVEAFDIYHDPGLYRIAKLKLATYRDDLPTESVHFKVHEGTDKIKSFQLSDRTVGCLSTRAGAAHPYRLVTGILSRLLRSYPTSFHLFAQTPCTLISAPDPQASVQLYSLTTPKGIIQTPHIIHATNGWISHLLPGMRGKIIPSRGVMTAQRPWKGLGQNPPSTPNLIPDLEKLTSWTGTRSFVLFPNAFGHRYDYLTQQMAAPDTISEKSVAHAMYPAPEGELMFGGGFTEDNAFLTELGNADDSAWNPETGKYLTRALDNYFEVEGGKGKEKEKDERVKAQWSGILGFSVDLKPWVGRIPEKVAGRCAPYAVAMDNVSESLKGSVGGSGTESSLSSKASARLADPGEWMAAGYSGEGMVHAWMSGKALAYMVLGLDGSAAAPDREKDEKREAPGDLETWFPHVFRISEKRWESTGNENLLAAFLRG